MRFSARRRPTSATGPLLAGLAAVLTGGGLLFWSRKASASQFHPEPTVVLPDSELPEQPPDEQPDDPVPAPSSPSLDSANPADGSSAPIAYDDNDIEAGARMIATENPRGSDRLKVEQLWTQIRQAIRYRQSLFARITAGSGFGGQGEKAGAGRLRPVASGNPATDAGRQLVASVLAGARPSEFAGAVKFFQPGAQDRAFAIAESGRRKKAAGEPLTKQEQRLLKYKRNAEGVRAKWSKEGAHAVGTIDGVEFWT